MNSEIVDRIRKLLITNSVQLQVSRNNIENDITYTAPSPGIYDQQWFWDSCLHSIVWSELGENERAFRELESLVIGKGDRDFIPHMIFWREIKNITDQMA